MLPKHMIKAARIGAIATVAGVVMASAGRAATQPEAIAPKPGTAIAQATDANPRYLSVTGQGRAFAPADKGALIFAFRQSSSYAYSEEAPEDYDSDAPISPDDLSAIKRALTAAGVSESDISFSKDQFGSFSEIDLTVRIDAPTRDRINALVDSVVAVDETEKSVELSAVQTYYSARDCEATEIKARRLAIADAQEQSTALAAISNVTIGDISSVSAHSDWGYLGGPRPDCPSDLEDVLQYASEYSQTYSRLDVPEVPFDVSISVSYFIE